MADIPEATPVTREMCPTPGCTREVQTRGHCHPCYVNLRRQGAIENLPEDYRIESKRKAWEMQRGEAWPEGHRRCTRCDELKPLEEFVKRTDTKGRDGYRGWCRPCRSEYSREYRQRTEPRASLPYLLWRNYQLTVMGWWKRYIKQNRLCAACSEPLPLVEWPFLAVTGIHVDHDHSCCPTTRSCGRCIRGLVHVKCNIGLGYFDDAPAKMRAAAKYLERWVKGRS